MKRKFLKMIAGIMCGVMMVTSNGVVTLAAPSEISETVSSVVSEEMLDESGIEIQADTEAIDVEGDFEIDSVNEKKEIADTHNPEQPDDEESDEAVETEETVSTEVINPANARAPEAIVECLTVDSEGVLSLLPEADKTKLPTEITAQTFRLLETEGKTVKVISAGIFDNNSSVEFIEIPKTVTAIADGAFINAQNLSKVSFEDGSNLTELPKEAFYNCKKLGTGSILWIPDTIKYIGEDCFAGCTGLSSIDVANSQLELIGKRAFQGCTSLGNVPLEKIITLKTISDRAFEGCSALKKVTLPSSVQEIASEAYKNCSSIELVDLSKTNNLNLKEYAFAYCGVREIKFSDTMSEVPSNAFGACNRLGVGSNGLAIPLIVGNNGTGITKICTNAFADCKALKEIELRESVNVVEANAFSGCSSVNKITVNSGASSMDDGATIELNATSFPRNQGMKIYGYGGTVKEWQGQYVSQGVKYESLYPAYHVAVPSYSKGLTLSLVNTEKELRIGDVLTIAVEPDEGYSVLSITVNGEVMQYNEAKKIATLTIKSNNIKNDAIQVEASFVENEKAQSGTYDVFIADANVKDSLEFVKTATNDEYNLIFGSSYMSTKLKFERNSEAIGNWAFNFRSSDSNTVSVDSDGNIRAIKKSGNPVVITATLKANEAVKKKINVTVNADGNLKELKYFSFGSNKKVIPTETIKRVEGSFSTYIDSNLGIEVLQISSNAAKSSDNTIPVTANAVNSLDKTVDCGYTWTVLDNKIVEVKSASTNGSENTLAVKAVGQTTVTATTKLADKAGKKLSRTFIVRVVDMTPIIEQNSITINPSSEEKTYFDVVPVYSSTITGYAIGKMTSAGFQEESNPIFVISQAQNNRFLIGLTERAKKQYESSSASFADYYLQVEIDHDKNVLYEAKLPKITISNVKPNASIKLSGKINTFYAGNSGATGQVSAVVSAGKTYILDNTVEPILLPLTKIPGDDQKFVDNFSVKAVKAGDNSKLVITQKVEKLACDANGRPVTTGYIRLKYVGYNAVDIKVTVPTEKKAPQYVLSQTKISTSVKAKGQILELQLLDKKTKQPVDLSEADVTYDPKESSVLFNEFGMKPTIENNIIRIELPNGIRSNATAVLDFINKNWSNDTPLQFALDVNAVSQLPKVTFTNSKVTINASCDNEVETGIKVTMANDIQDISFSDFAYAGKSSATEEGKKITVKYEENVVKASYEEGNAPKSGTYSFKATPTVTYLGGTTEVLSPVTIKVAIVEKVPSIKLSASSATLNSNLAGENIETATIKYSWKNMTQGSVLGYVPDTSKAEIRCDGKEYEFDKAPINVNFVVENNIPYIHLTANASFCKKTKVVVKNLSIGNATVSDLSFTVKANTKVPKLSVITKGAINVLDDDSAIICTVAMKNYSGTLNPENVKILAEAAYGETFDKSSHFELKPDAEFGKNKKIYLKVKPDCVNEIRNIEYTILLNAQLGALESDIFKLSFKPVQTMSKLSVNPTSMNFYMGAAGMEKTVVVSQPSVKTQITDVKWASTTSDTVKKAFEAPSYDTATGKLTIKLRNPALLVSGSSYSLEYEIVCKNQLLNTKGSTFTVKVTMK